MNLYLYVVANTHPNVQKRYKYLVNAPNRDTAMHIMLNADGKHDPDFCIVESCTKVSNIDTNVYYLPDYDPEDLIV